MATKKAKTTKNVKGTKMATKTTAKAKKTGTKASATEREVVTIKPYEGPITIIPNDRDDAAEARAEAVEAVDGLDPEARAEAVEPEAIGAETAAATKIEHAWEISKNLVDLAETAGTEDAVEILRSLGFERTGKQSEEVRYADLVNAAKNWRDANSDEERREAESIAARAGWFRPPASVPEAGAMPAPAETNPAGKAERLLLELGFQKTGRIIEDVRPNALLCAAETWRDRKDRESKIAAEDVVSRAGWFRAPGVAPAATAAPTFEVEHEGRKVRVTVPEDDAKTPVAVTPDLAALRVDVEEANFALAAAEAEAKRLEDEARAALAKAKERYRAALAPYRDACKVQGHTCEYEGGGRGANVSEKVTFVVERVGDDIRIAVKDRAETEETIPVADVRAALNKTAYGYTDRHVGPREAVGNKGGTLSNKLRAAVAQ